MLVNISLFAKIYADHWAMLMFIWRPRAGTNHQSFGWQPTLQGPMLQGPHHRCGTCLLLAARPRVFWQGEPAQHPQLPGGVGRAGRQSAVQTFRPRGDDGRAGNQGNEERKSVCRRRELRNTTPGRYSITYQQKCYSNSSCSLVRYQLGLDKNP